MGVSRAGYNVDPEFAHEVRKSTGSASSLRRFAEDLSSGKELPIKMTDATMEPFIKVGDTMVFGPCNLENTRAGDFILVRAGSGVVPRRVIRRSMSSGEAVFITKGQKSKELDPPTRVAQALGRLVHLDRKGRRISARSLNRGLLDTLTDYGSRSVSDKLKAFFWSLVPRSLRPKDAL